MATNANALFPGQSYCGASLTYVVPSNVGGSTTPDIIAIFENFDGSGLTFAENDTYTLDESLMIPAGTGGNITLLAISKSQIYNALGLLANPVLCPNFVPDPDPATPNNEACEAIAAYYASLSGPQDITVASLLGILASLGGTGVPTTTTDLIALLDAVEAGSSGLITLDFSDTSLNVYVSEIINVNVVVGDCDDAGTPADPSDDSYTFQVSAILNAPPSLGTASYSLTGDYSTTGLAYGMPNDSDPLLISDGPLAIDLVDTNSPCTEPFTVTPPATCSAGLDCDPATAGVQGPGSACNDGNAGTTNDVYDASCVCAGTALPPDCLGVPGGTATIGSACDDGNAGTTNDVFDASCICAGTPLPSDCLGVPGGTATIGSACDDGNAGTTNDVYDASCVCAGTPLPSDCLGVPGGTATIGSACDDGNAGTTNDVYNSSCVCMGTDAVQINLSDPCSCADPANVIVAGAIIRFAETITITGPANTVYTLSAQTGMTDAAGVALATGSTTVTADAMGVATFSFFHTGTPGGFTATFTSAFGPESISGGGCSLAVCNGSIPTASEWGLLCLGLSLMSLMVIFVRQRETVIA